MLNQQTIHKLLVMRLNGMADAFRQQLEQPGLGSLSFEERFGLLVDRQWDWKENRALARRLRNSRLRTTASVEDINYQKPRGLDRALMRSLAAESEWVKQHLNILLTGATGLGKSWLAAALAHKACRDGYTVYHARAAQLFRELALAHADGSFSRFLRKLALTDVLVVDDFCMTPLNEAERRDFLEICDDRYQTRSTVLTSQIPVPDWHAQIGDPTAADSILDRLVHNAHRIELAGESMRKRTTGARSEPEPRGGKEAL
ncbi:MAG TPA: IS21-like element helper ATPase IstB [Bryobacteraceae bacterium]|jgi:DNA replication protein DnaC|nr:IS21-like element helper ATPase IstB [Bryobacteraceae bacterium]